MRVSAIVVSILLLCLGAYGFALDNLKHSSPVILLFIVGYVVVGVLTIAYVFEKFRK